MTRRRNYSSTLRNAKDLISKAQRLEKKYGKGKPRKPWVNLALLIIVALVCVSGLVVPKPHDSSGEAVSKYSAVTESAAPSNGERVTVERCVDGDTIIVHSSVGRERVRFIGCDTPETVKPNHPVEPFGPEASAYTKERIAAAGNVVHLVSDGDKQDRYGRRLAIVYLGNDEISLNEDLVRRGLARATLQYNFSRAFKDRLYVAEETAKSERLGIHGGRILGEAPGTAKSDVLGVDSSRNQREAQQEDNRSLEFFRDQLKKSLYID
ncbi:MAG: thermonuclease family protein [Thermoguttaceae bacterium]